MAPHISDKPSQSAKLLNLFLSSVDVFFFGDEITIVNGRRFFNHLPDDRMGVS